MRFVGGRSKGKQAGDFVNPDAHEPIVDAILWRKAQPERGKPRRSSEGALLAGILRCASCRRKLSPSGQYYRCRPRMVTGPECPGEADRQAVNARQADQSWIAQGEMLRKATTLRN